MASVLEHGEKERILGTIDVTNRDFSIEAARSLIKETPAIELLNVHALDKAWHNLQQVKGEDVLEAAMASGADASVARLKMIKHAEEVKDLITLRMDELDAGHLAADRHSGRIPEGAAAVFVAKSLASERFQTVQGNGH